MRHVLPDPHFDIEHMAVLHTIIGMKGSSILPASARGSSSRQYWFHRFRRSLIDSIGHFQLGIQISRIPVHWEDSWSRNSANGILSTQSLCNTLLLSVPFSRKISASLLSFSCWIRSGAALSHAVILGFMEAEAAGNHRWLPAAFPL